MFESNKIKDNRMISKELLQRIDNMEDDTDFDPYKAVKRNSINADELFNERDYEIQEEDIILQDADKLKKEKTKTVIIAIIVGTLMTGALGILIYLVYIGGLNL